MSCPQPLPHDFRCLQYRTKVRATGAPYRWHSPSTQWVASSQEWPWSLELGELDLKTDNATVSCSKSSLGRRPSCGCKSALVPEAVLPQLLHFRGEHPAWDEYLDMVYGHESIQYPFRLSALRWLYRCDCRTVDVQCRPTHGAACHVTWLLEQWANQSRFIADPRLRSILPFPQKVWRAVPSWRSSCIPGAQAPIGPVLPKVWLSSHAYSVDGNAQREAFVGMALRTYPAPMPEHMLAPFGLWIYPMPYPLCIESKRWVEVMRVVQPYEHVEWPLSIFYFHAPGSGIWLNLGFTRCCNNHLNYDRLSLIAEYGPEYSPPREQAGFVHKSSTPSCQPLGRTSHKFRCCVVGTCSEHERRGCQTRRSATAVDTLQRRANAGNLLEIIDLRLERLTADSYNPIEEWGPCGPGLRAGYNASRPCRCDRSRLILNCAG